MEFHICVKIGKKLGNPGWFGSVFMCINVSAWNHGVLRNCSAKNFEHRKTVPVCIANYRGRPAHRSTGPVWDDLSQRLWAAICPAIFHLLMAAGKFGQHMLSCNRFKLLKF
jgi:hypothetical protein